MSRRQQNIIMPPAATAHSLSILAEYTHTLDSLPLDLSRNFADLRELDAVLSSSMAALTTKITTLTEMIENKHGSKEERLWLLVDIAEEAHRLKLGGEDKIRVACHAADGLRGHKAHMRELLRHVPDPEYDDLADRLWRKTVYPHVSRHQYVPLGLNEGGRRQRRGALSNGNNVEASPAKRKRVVVPREEELEMPKSPRKPERTVDATRPRANGRAKRLDRAASPAESVLSVASHLPPPHHAQAPAHVLGPKINGHTRVASLPNKRSRNLNGAPDAMQVHLDSRRESYNAPPSSSAAHPSLPAPFTNGAAIVSGPGIPPLQDDGARSWMPGQLEGPGMPVARYPPSQVQVIADQADPGVATGTEADGDADDGKTYCFCETISYGAMIACDDKNCEREWFHLTCVGLTDIPDGTWYCDSCLAKRNARRTARGGKKRSGGGARNGTRKTSDLLA